MKSNKYIVNQFSTKYAYLDFDKAQRTPNTYLIVDIDISVRNKIKRINILTVQVSKIEISEERLLDSLMAVLNLFLISKNLFEYDSLLIHTVDSRFLEISQKKKEHTWIINDPIYFDCRGKGELEKTMILELLKGKIKPDNFAKQYYKRFLDKFNDEYIEVKKEIPGIWGVFGDGIEFIIGDTTVFWTNFDNIKIQGDQLFAISHFINDYKNELELKYSAYVINYNKDRKLKFLLGNVFFGYLRMPLGLGKIYNSKENYDALKQVLHKEITTAEFKKLWDKKVIEQNTNIKRIKDEKLFDFITHIVTGIIFIALMFGFFGTITLIKHIFPTQNNSQNNSQTQYQNKKKFEDKYSIMIYYKNNSKGKLNVDDLSYIYLNSEPKVYQEFVNDIKTLFKADSNILANFSNKAIEVGSFMDKFPLANDFYQNQSDDLFWQFYGRSRTNSNQKLGFLNFMKLVNTIVKKGVRVGDEITYISKDKAGKNKAKFIITTLQLSKIILI